MCSWLKDSSYNSFNDETVFIDVSNAFNYEVNATLYSKNVRINVERDYIKFFEENTGKFITKGFVIESVNNHIKFPYLPKLFPWQKI